jgi:FtsP/CotA-like multicopper oxidase with cupredoxin domain
MSPMKMNTRNVATRLLYVAVAAVTLLFSASAYAAAPGIAGTSFKLDAHDGYTTQPDGAVIYSWGYGCLGGALAPGNTYAPLAFANLGFCPTMQMPGPTLIVPEGQNITVTLTNNLPTPAGYTSILFPGFTVTATSCIGTCRQGVLTTEVAPPASTGGTGSTVTYTFNTTGKAGTHAYYSGTQPDLQIEMGMYGAVIVVPSSPAATCTAAPESQTMYKHAASAYDTLASTCYDREYLFQWAEMDPRIHFQAEQQVLAAGSTGKAPLNIKTEPYKSSYFLINGRSMPDDMDSDYAPNYPNQPYNGNPHMHPGDLVLIRTIGQGRLQHPFHEHANHVRILARDGNLILSQTNPNLLAGRLEFNTDTTPGQAFDGIFYWSGKGLNWDIYGHKAGDGFTCTPDANGYNTGNSPTSVYHEWCADHDKALETNPVGAVEGGGPMTLPDPLIMTNGLWYNGTPYLGPNAVFGSKGPTPLPPGGALQNPPNESGIAFMWHSHNEREITTNDIFPGGMMMMMLVDPLGFHIDETL